MKGHGAGERSETRRARFRRQAKGRGPRNEEGERREPDQSDEVWRDE